METIPTFKICLVGGARAGKTTWLNRHITGEFKSKYIATLGCDLRPIVFHTNKGPIRFNVWDCAGDPRYGGLGDGYYIQSQGVIFFHTNDEETVKCMLDYRRVVSGGPIIVVKSFVDAEGIENPYKELLKFKNLDGITALYTISGKSCYNFEKPFLTMARSLMNDPNLVFVMAPMLNPPHAPDSPDYFAMISEAAATPLPDE